jgi:hypothetical protein
MGRRFQSLGEGVLNVEEGNRDKGLVDIVIENGRIARSRTPLAELF